jgi:CBS domain containing-hemolysin-like protein
MITAVLIIVYISVIYLSFTVNVFQFGLYLFDNADGESFEGVDERKRKKLNRFFDDLSDFNQFVSLFDDISIIAASAIALIITGQIAGNDKPVFAGVAAGLLLITLFLHHVISQTLSKRVSNKWVISTLTSRLTLVTVLAVIGSPFVGLVRNLAERHKREQLSEEQKEDMVERAIETLASTAGLDEPLVDEAETEMIGNIFELDQTSVRETMVPRTEIIGIPITASFEEIQQKVEETGHSRFPVFGDDLDDIRGILYAKDLFCAFPLPSEGFTLLDYTRRAYFVPATKVVSDLLNELKKTHNHMAIVVDEYGGTAGLITMEDVIEIIVGDIQDEHDTEQAEIVKIGDDTFRVDANVSIEKLAEEVGLELEHTEFETVGGLIYDLVGSLPSVGQSVANDHFEFVVEKMDGQRIEVVRVKVFNN